VTICIGLRTLEVLKARVHIDRFFQKTRENRSYSPETWYSEDFQVSTSEKCQSLKSRAHAYRRFRIPLVPSQPLDQVVEGKGKHFEELGEGLKINRGKYPIVDD
jgi:hypothetical protein